MATSAWSHEGLPLSRGLACRGMIALAGLSLRRCLATLLAPLAAGLLLLLAVGAAPAAEPAAPAEKPVPVWGSLEHPVTILGETELSWELPSILQECGLRGVVLLDDADTFSPRVWHGDAPSVKDPADWDALFPQRKATLLIVNRPARQAITDMLALFPGYLCRFSTTAHGDMVLIYPEHPKSKAIQALLEVRDFPEEFSLPLPLTPVRDYAVTSLRHPPVPRGPYLDFPVCPGQCGLVNLVEATLADVGLPFHILPGDPERDPFRYESHRNFGVPRVTQIQEKLRAAPAQESWLDRVARVVSAVKPSFCVVVKACRVEDHRDGIVVKQPEKLFVEIGSGVDLSALPVDDLFQLASAKLGPDIAKKWSLGLPEVDRREDGKHWPLYFVVQAELARRGESAFKILDEKTPRRFQFQMVLSILHSSRFIYSDTAIRWAHQATKVDDGHPRVFRIFLENVYWPGMYQHLDALLRTANDQEKASAYGNLRYCHRGVDEPWRERWMTALAPAYRRDRTRGGGYWDADYERKQNAPELVAKLRDEATHWRQQVMAALHVDTQRDLSGCFR